MTFWTLIRRSLRFHARAHLGVVLGAAVGSAALIGALVVGDSVRESLRRMALARLGKVEFALTSNDRLFRSALATDLQNQIQIPTAAALLLPGTAANSDGTARANQVQVLGVDQRFWTLANQPPSIADNPADGVILNSALAGQLHVSAGDTVVLRVQKPSRLSREAPITPQQDFNVALRLPVTAVVADEAFGRFSLQANQVPPFNAFVPLPLLEQRVDATNRANLLLVAQSNRSPNLTNAQAALRGVWKLADAELQLRTLTHTAGLELRSSRVFLDPPVVDAATNAAPGAYGILTYFVNELRMGERSTPYSMVTATAHEPVPPEMKDDEIMINQWLADDLQAKAGDTLVLNYYVLGQSRRLEERTNQFRVRGVVPLAGAAADRELMPDFPGVADAEKTHDWDTGFPIHMERIRDKDEQYWTDYRGTPKAFVTLAAGQQLWANRFGNLTAVRYPTNTVAADEVRAAIQTSLPPSAIGLAFQPVREQALKATTQSTDFGGLFLGFSFFLIIAALILMALLFQFSLEQRAEEVGTLLALGLRPGRVRRLWWSEGSALAFLGGLIGVAGGVLYARAMLLGLTTLWRDAVGTSALEFHATAATLVMGLLASVLVSALTIWLVLRKQAKRPARELLDEGAAAEAKETGARRGTWGWWFGIFGIGGALATVGWALAEHKTSDAEAFFGAGSMFLIGGLGFAAVLLARLNRSAAAQRLTLTGMGLRGSARRRKRSLATIALLACGSFMVVAVGANRLDANRDATERSSGTGGFALIGQATLPVVHDLNSQAGRDFFGLENDALQNVELVPMRVRNGDDASCLNLNRAQTPRLLGVAPEALASRDAFTFAGIADGFQAEQPWLLLNGLTPDGEVPAIGDQASIVWAMGKKLGDTLTFTDERGNTFQVRLVAALANSILQGNLIISETNFTARFPGESGYRMFLIDAPSNRVSAVSATLTRALQDVGLELTPAPQRLAAFNAVQNTYLSTFQVLGGLGLLLGSAGLGVVVLRNVLERRGELALLLAVGFRRRALQWLVLSEHGGLLCLGLTVGILAALVSILPVITAPGAEVHYLALMATLAGVLLSGMLWTWLATRWALRGRLVDALRNE